jgi:ferric-dicitrate binding protein FerR (iron transport regulator)
MVVERKDRKLDQGGGFMAVTSHSIPADLVAGVRAGDDQSIERGFLSLFPALVAAADADLHDKASSSRVVERAFLQVMSGAPPADAQAFDVALSQAIHQAVVREQSRKGALRRFERNEGVTHQASHTETVDAATSWRHRKEARAKAAGGHAQLDQTESQHVAAAHMRQTMDRDNNKKWLIPLGIGVLLVGAVGYGMTKLDSRPSEKFVMAQLNAATAKSIATRPGQVGNISLGDGTQMKIAAGSQLKVVNNFGEKLRAVLVKGAASFTIAPDKKPFELRGRGVGVSATEGKIDFRSDEGRPELVRVVAGSPQITVGDSSWAASAGQTFVMDPTGVRPASAAELDEAFAWMDGRFVVNGTIKEVVAGIRRWYDMDVGIGDNSIADWPAQATGTLESLTSTINSLQKSAKVKMVWQNRQMLLYRR